MTLEMMCTLQRTHPMVLKGIQCPICEVKFRAGDDVAVVNMNNSAIAVHFACAGEEE
jgi:hypothetical protein